MSKITEAVWDYRAKVVKDDNDLKLREPEYQFKIIRHQVIKACQSFVEKDLIHSSSLTPDEIRGLLLNRIRTNLSYLNQGLSIEKRSVRNLYLGFNQGRTDITSIRLYSHNFSNDEITGGNIPSKRWVCESLVALAKVFDEINAVGSLRAYLKITNPISSDVKSIDNVDPSGDVIKSPYAKVLIPLLQKDFHTSQKM